MTERSLDWRIEEACHNAWPAVRQVWLGDWMLKFAPGVSRRANSANPMGAGAGAGGVDALVAAGAGLYRAQGLPLLVRVLSLLDPAVVDRVVAAVAADLADGSWDERHGHLRTLDAFDAGMRLVVARP